MRGMLGAAALVVLCPAVVPAQTPPCASTTGRSVSVNGSATLRVPPDRVSFTVGVETVAPNLLHACKANNAKPNTVLAALKAKGVQPKEMQTSNLDISSRDPREPEGRKAPPSFRVANLVTVTREDPSTVSDLIQVAVVA